jgi:acyl-CoA reductase-like NAD-dependent aldehyde dehydrogenase
MIDIPANSEARRRLVHERILPTLDLRPFIAGDFVPSSSTNRLNVIDPMTQEELAQIPSAGKADVDAAVSAARAAFDNGSWSDLHPRARARFLYRLADLIERDLTTLALLEAADTGKRYRGVLGWDVPNAAEVYRYYAGWADKITGMALPSLPGVEIFTRREPVGVCAAIVPWNFPFPCMAWKIGPALAVGCTVVVKSAERAPLSAQYLARLVKEAGFPKGVINIICGVGEEAGRLLVSDPRVDKITFTGEAATAQDIITASLSHLPRLTLELGDKVPNIICDDADLQAATTSTVGAIFGLAGQNCCAGSRTLVHSRILDQVVDRLAAAATARRLGDQFADDTEQGPQIDLEHVSRIDRFVKQAVSDGGHLVTGGAPTGNGQFYAPTIITGTNNDMRINRQEVFGPVGTIIPFSDLDEAIHIANDRDFGLAAAVWTRNQKTADLFARKLRTGTCWINCYEYFDTVAPWGGRKLSGTGRELGVQGIEAFLEEKTIVRVY